MKTREMKHYFGRFSGRLAGIANWKGGHFYTSDYHVQQKIENHPMYLAGIIETVGDTKKKEAPRSTDVDLMSYSELQKLGRDKGLHVVGMKKADLIQALKE